MFVDTQGGSHPEKPEKPEDPYKGEELLRHKWGKRKGVMLPRNGGIKTRQQINRSKRKASTDNLD